jgi:class 3 adenylate cyclase
VIGHGGVDPPYGMDVPDPQYIKTEDGAYIAFQVVGDGPVDIAWQLDGGGGLDVWWELTSNRWWFEGLASLGRLILHDWRATGLSSRNVPAPNLETRMADLRAVLDAAGSKSAVMGGWYESLAPCVLLAASDPSRVQALVWWDPCPRTTWSPDYPWGDPPAEIERSLRALEHWGTVEYARAWAEGFEAFTSVRPPDEEVRWEAKMSRNCCTPDVAHDLREIWLETDIRPVLPSVQAPTLLMVTVGDAKNVAIAEHVAELMPNAVIEAFPPVGLPTTWADNEVARRPKLDALQRFLGIQTEPSPDQRILSTVLFTDIVSSTEHQARLGDRAWKDIVQRHHAIVRAALAEWLGTEIDTAGDGFYATFEGPARAIRCGLQIVGGVRELGIEVRAGIHTGECHLVDGKVAGIAVTIGARIAALAGPSQVLVSRTVRDLVAGSGFRFQDAGEHELRGIPDLWRLHAATASG